MTIKIEKLNQMIELDTQQTLYVKGKGDEEDMHYDKYLQLLNNPNVSVTVDKQDGHTHIQMLYVEPGNSIQNIVT